jgi:hypothetical protein
MWCSAGMKLLVLYETVAGTSEAHEMEIAASSLWVCNHLLTPQHHNTEGHGLNITSLTLRLVMFIAWQSTW